MRTSMLAAVVVLSAGCTGVPREEAAWQVLHAADVLQTIQIAKNPECYYENDPITSRLIGKHPSESEVVIWGVATAALHAGVSMALDHYDVKPWIKDAWNIVSIVSVGYTVAHNYKIGIGITDSNNC